MQTTSRPIRGAWIEIVAVDLATGAGLGRAPYGARGLKLRETRDLDELVTRRAPYGARGLKFGLRAEPVEPAKSRPIRGAWIEIH